MEIDNQRIISPYLRNVELKLDFPVRARRAIAADLPRWRDVRLRPAAAASPARQWAHGPVMAGQIRNLVRDAAPARW